MRMSENISGALSQLRKNKLRSFLTILGIVIGIASMVTVISVGQGGQQRINDELLQFGINRVWLFTEDTLSGRRTLTLADAELIADNVPDVGVVSPAVYVSTYVSSGGTSVASDVGGVTPALWDIEEVRLDTGRFLNAGDMDYARRVIVLSHRLKEQLFGHRDAVGQTVSIGGAAFEVVGVCAENGGLAGAVVSPKSFVPIDVMMDVMNLTNIDEISVSAAELDGLGLVTTSSVNLLSQKYGQGTVKKIDLANQLTNANSILTTFTLVITAIAAVSLLVGGIGIMNIMLVTVKERTREIGVRKALGARRRDIFAQFLTEALIFAVIGGALGILLAAGLVYAVQELIGMEMTLSWPAAAASVGLSALIGGVFGVVPARRAASLDPVEALRHES